MAKKAANGEGCIYQRKDGWWVWKYTAGRDPGTGKQKQICKYGKTQKEVLEKKKAHIASTENGTYAKPVKLTVTQWLDTWTDNYLGGVKPRTGDTYKDICRLYLKPALGAVKLQALCTDDIQGLYNQLQREKELKPKTIKCIHGVLHKALQKAIELNYIRHNPAQACELPRAEKRAMTLIPDDSINKFLNAIQGHKYEMLYFVDLFTGMRQGEILSLTWDCVDFERGTLLINKQLQRKTKSGGEYNLVPTKSDRTRKMTPAPLVMDKLREQKSQQAEMQLLVGSAWSNPMNLVFTNEFGRNYAPTTVYNHLKRMVASIGIPEARFHDLRHSYAVTCLQFGDDIKTIQENMGHHTAAFTLDVYGHVTDHMRKNSADRMDKFIKATLNCG